LRRKSIALTGLFIDLVEQKCAGHGLELASPREGEARGSQVSVLHEDGYAVMQELIARGVVGDFRRPNLMRFGFAPLYLSYRNIWDAAETLREVLEDGAWRTRGADAGALVT
jgi:kynureninase